MHVSQVTWCFLLVSKCRIANARRTVLVTKLPERHGGRGDRYKVLGDLSRFSIRERTNMVSSMSRNRYVQRADRRVVARGCLVLA